MESERVESNLARRVVEKFALTPPMKNLLSVIENYAQVIHQKLPVDVDGATIYLPGKKPTVIINSGRNQQRTRFTMAHELGHVLIPSHDGDFLDADINDYAYDWREREANTFAAELLMPSEWVLSRIQKFSDPRDLVKTIAEEAHVSGLAATFRVISLLPPGYVFARIDADQQVLYSARSIGTFATTPRKGQKIADSHYSLAERRWSSKHTLGESTLWWKFPLSIEFSGSKTDLPWQVSLAEMLKDIEAAGLDAGWLQRSINGVLGSANSDLKGEVTQGQILAAFWQRIHGKATEDPTYRELLNHPMLEQFLASRALQLHIKRKG